MDFIDALVAKAASQLGVTEATGANDGEPSRLYMCGRQEPWCAHFIAWLFRNIGYPLPTDHHSPQGNPLASVTHMEGVFKDHFQLLEADQMPRVGDVLFLKTRGRSDRQAMRHCGLVVAVHEGLRTFQTIEGNIPNRVGKVLYSFSNKSISGFGRIPDLETLKNAATPN